MTRGPPIVAAAASRRSPLGCCNNDWKCWKVTRTALFRLIPLKCKMVRPREVLEIYNWFGGCERVGDERWPSMLRAMDLGYSTQRLFACHRPGAAQVCRRCDIGMSAAAECQESCDLEALCHG